MNAFLFAFLGFFAGFFVCTRVGTASYMVVREVTTARKAGSPIWPAVMAGLFSSGPWVLVGALVFVGWFFASANPPTWVYPFIKGFGVGPVVYALIVASAFRKFKKASAKPSVQA